VTFVTPPQLRGSRPAAGPAIGVNSNSGLRDEARPSQSRNRLYLFLSEVTDVVDPSSGINVELASVQITFTAPTSALDSLGVRAEAAGVAFQKSEEDF
jgi:hypothetical protein